MNFTEVKTLRDLENIYPKHILEKFPITGKGPFPETPDEDWQNWKWQLQNRTSDLKEVSKCIDITKDEKLAFETGFGKFKMSVNRYILALMNPSDPNCPIRRQAIPSTGELKIVPEDMEDPLSEEEQMPAQGITHRYPDRVLFYVSNNCPMLCRHCTRKRKVNNSCTAVSKKQIDEGVAYIREHEEVRDVVVSGGDPLCLNNEVIEYILKSLREIPHVEFIRIGSRTPVTLPFRHLDNELLKILQKYQPIHINTHFNHPKEMTRESLLAVTRLSLAGITMANQSVLLKNINDNSEIMKELCQKLLLFRVRPYYIFQCDLAEGTSHFRTTVDEGVQIINEMRGWTSGLAIPQFVIDSPGGGGKIPINPQYFLKKEGNQVHLRNYRNEEYVYYEPEESS